MGLHIVVLMDVFQLRKEAMRQLSNEFCHQKITAEPTSPYKKGTDLLIVMEKASRWISWRHNTFFSRGISLKGHSFMCPSPNWRSSNYILCLYASWMHSALGPSVGHTNARLKCKTQRLRRQQRRQTALSEYCCVTTGAYLLSRGDWGQRGQLCNVLMWWCMGWSHSLSAGTSAGKKKRVQDWAHCLRREVAESWTRGIMMCLGGFACKEKDLWKRGTSRARMLLRRRDM